MPFRQPKARDELEYFDKVVDGEDVVMIHDPVRGTYYKFNPLQAAMLRKLDGIRSLDEMTAELSEQFEVEIPRHAAERFLSQARKMTLLDIGSFNVSQAKAQTEVIKELKKLGFKFRNFSELETSQRSQRVVSAEAVMFMGGLRHLQQGEPAKALDYFHAVLEINPDNQRTKTLVEAIQRSYVKALSGSSTDFPTFGTFDPTRLLTFLDRTVGKLVFHWFAALVLLALVVVTGYELATTAFPKLDFGVLDIALAIVLILTHAFLHELGHGLTCNHYGGKVREIGFTVFYRIAALPYCDTSSTYLFTNRRHKLAVSAGGSVVSLVLVCLSVVLLAVTNPTSFFYRAVYIHLCFAAVSLVGNVVPFMKYDGYYFLCDLLGTPNLRERSFKLLKSSLSKRLFDIDSPEEEIDPNLRYLFIMFAALSLVWTVVWMYQTVFRLMAPAIERYQGAGLITSVTVISMLLRNTLVTPFKQLGSFLLARRKEIFTARRGLVMTGILSLLVLPWLISYPVLVDAEFVSIPQQRQDARAEVAGNLEQVFVQEGDTVTKGQPLGRLVNHELDRLLAVGQSELAALDAKIDKLRRGATAEELALAKSRTLTAEAMVNQETRAVRVAASMSSAGVGTAAAVDSRRGSAAASASLASVAQWREATLVAGSRIEVIAAATAERARLAAQLDHIEVDLELLVVRSPIAGIVTTPRLSDKRFTRLERGDTLAQVQDMSSSFAEIRLAANVPLAELEIGSEIELRSDGFPALPIKCRIDRFRNLAETDNDAKEQGDPTARDIVVVTSPFSVPHHLMGLTGHARVYGNRRSLAYTKLYLPLQRVARVVLWSLM